MTTTNLSLISLALLASGAALAQGDALCPESPVELYTILQATPASDRQRATDCFIQMPAHYPWIEIEPFVVRLLDHEDPQARSAGIMSIAAALWLGTASVAVIDERHGKVLWRILDTDPSLANRADAGNLLVSMQTLPAERMRGPLFRLLDGGDTTVAFQALHSLTDLGLGASPAAVRFMLASAKDSDARVRRSAYNAMGRAWSDVSVPPAEVVDLLIEGLNEQDTGNRIESANALNYLSHAAHSAAPDLQAIVWNPEQPAELRKAAKDAVEQITGMPTRPPWATEQSSQPEPEPGTAGSRKDRPSE